MRRYIRLLHDGSGFQASITDTATVHFADVKEIFAFKRDLMTVDLICLAFRTSDDASAIYIEVDEEMEGYSELLETLKVRFGIKLEDWFWKVAFPAFESNLTTLWGRPSPRQ